MEILLRNQYVSGRVLRYRGSTHVRQEVKISGVTTNEQEQHWDAVLVQRVIAAEADGSGHVVTLAVPELADPAAIEAALDGQTQVTYVHMGPTGRVLRASTATPPSTFTFPEQGISPGMTWEGMSQFALPPNGHVANVPFTYQFREMQDVNGNACAVLEVFSPHNEWEVTLQEGQEPAVVSLETKGTIWFDVVRGLLVRSEMETVTTPQIGGQSVATTTSTLQELTSVELTFQG
ncbi:MAG: hypothetical protein ACYCW6_21945 [Candidatus Xenobia bacterium]